MTTDDTGLNDLTLGLVALEYQALKTEQDYAGHLQAAESAGEQEIADFLRQVIREDSERALRIQTLLHRLRGADDPLPPQR